MSETAPAPQGTSLSGALLNPWGTAAKAIAGATGNAALGGVADSVNKVMSAVGMWALVTLLTVAGLLLILRKPVASIVEATTPVGKAASIIGAVS